MTVARVSPEVNIQTSIEIYRNIARAGYIRKPDVPVIYGSKTRPGKERVGSSAVSHTIENYNSATFNPKYKEKVTTMIRFPACLFSIVDFDKSLPPYLLISRAFSGDVMCLLVVIYARFVSICYVLNLCKQSPERNKFTVIIVWENVLFVLLYQAQPVT